MDINDVDASPLEAALVTISRRLDGGASGAEEMRQLLWDIKDEVEAALLAFRENIEAVSKAELEALRKELNL